MVTTAILEPARKEHTDKPVSSIRSPAPPITAELFSPLREVPNLREIVQIVALVGKGTDRLFGKQG